MCKFIVSGFWLLPGGVWLLPVLAGFLSLSSCGIKGSPRKPGESITDTPGSKVSEVDSTAVEWAEVVRLSGEGNLRSDLFALSGQPSRLTYSFLGRAQALAGVYLVREDDTLQEDGGSLLIIMKGNELGVKTLDGSTGTFYMEVLGEGGSWSVVLEEEHTKELKE